MLGESRVQVCVSSSNHDINATAGAHWSSTLVGNGAGGGPRTATAGEPPAGCERHGQLLCLEGERSLPGRGGANRSHRQGLRREAGSGGSPLRQTSAPRHTHHRVGQGRSRMSWLSTAKSVATKQL